MTERKELLFTNMDEIFFPKEHMSEYGLSDKWRVVPYVTDGIAGKMLACLKGGTPGDLTFSPNLTGWYRIYFCLNDGRLCVKTNEDEGFFRVEPPTAGIEEFCWRCMDMTGKSLTISMRPNGNLTRLLAIRFIPMTDEEVAEWQYEDTRTDTKRIYATDDTHNRLLSNVAGDSVKDWYPAVLQYLHSDVEWISLEQIRHFVTKTLPTENVDDFLFSRECDKWVQKNIYRFDLDAILYELVKLGQDNGFKMSLSIRMGAWGMAYPGDQHYFDSDFAKAHQHCRCVDRNGDPMTAMSYAYPEVQDFMIDELLNMARSGCEAVTLIATRGIPYVLFEKPVADRFFEMYGEYPYELPLDEPRLSALHCQIMTEFMRRVRDALDAEFGKDKVEIHMHVLNSVFDSKVIALDVERWAKEGLLQAAIPYPKRFYENIPADHFKPRSEGEPWRIDLDKYTDTAWNSRRRLFVHSDQHVFDEPYTNYRGELCGPKTQAERIGQWMELERKYGMKVYINVMPRWMPNEDYRKRIMDLYEAGAERFCMWDTYGRVLYPVCWNAMAGKIGHKDEIAAMPGDDPNRRTYSYKKLCGMDVSRYHPNWGG